MTQNCIQVGNLVLMQEGEQVPADILILDTSEVANRENICYVSEKNIWGGGNNTEKRAPLLLKCTEILKLWS